MLRGQPKCQSQELVLFDQFWVRHDLLHYRISYEAQIGDSDNHSRGESMPTPRKIRRTLGHDRLPLGRVLEDLLGECHRK